MYALIADVGSYPEFLPWCSAARVRSTTPLPDGSGEVMEADLVISFKVYRERFGSRVTLRPGERRIDVEYLEGPFRYLQNHWKFIPLGESRCEVDFFVDFEFRSAILQKLIGLVFHEAMLRIVRAFEKRAEALYGAPRQRLKRELERGLDAPRPHLRPAEGAEAAPLGAGLLGGGDGEPDQALGLALRAARPGDAGDGDRELGRRGGERALGHGAGHRLGDRAVLGRASPAAPRASRSWRRRNR